MTDTKKRIEEVLNAGHVMSLGTVDDGGVWVADVVYIFDEGFNIYWMSDPDVRHSCAVEANSKVAATITISNKSKEKNLGIQFDGVAAKINGPRFDLAKLHLKKRGHPEPKETDDVLQGDSWYHLKPIKIELIDEENHGFEKEVYNLA
jgi:uncharacterized protein YhbP (UPF0306 family)